MNNEAILNKLIELGYLDNDITLFDAVTSNTDYFILQRALFDECGKRGYIIKIIENKVEVYWCTFNFEGEEENISDNIYEDYTSRESFVKAFCKVVGV